MLKFHVMITLDGSTCWDLDVICTNSTKFLVVQSRARSGPMTITSQEVRHVATAVAVS